MFTAALLIIAPNWKPPKCPSTREWINKLWSINLVKIIINKKDLPTDTETTQMVIKNIMWSK